MSDRWLERAILKVFGWTFACLALLCGVCILYVHNNNPERTARRAHEALVERNAEQLLSLASPEEVEALGLTERNLQKFIDDYVFRGFSRVEFDGDYDNVEQDFPSVSYRLSRKYRLDGKATTAFYFSANSDGTIDHLILSLFEGRSALSQGGTERESDYRMVRASTIERDLDLLRATGISGIYDGSKTLNWGVYAAQLRDWERRN